MHFLSRVSILARDIDIGGLANLSVCPSVRLSVKCGFVPYLAFRFPENTGETVRPSVRNVPVSDENGLIYRDSFFTIQ